MCIRDRINNFFTKTGRSATVSNYLAGWLSEWVREYGVDGFRCDKMCIRDRCNSPVP